MPVTSLEYYKNQLVEINNAFVEKSGPIINAQATPILTAAIEKVTLEPTKSCYRIILLMSRTLKDTPAKKLEPVKKFIRKELHPMLKNRLTIALSGDKEKKHIKQIIELDIWSAEDLKFMGYQN